MAASRSSRVTQLLEHYEPADRACAERLFADVYQELRRLAANCLRRERKGHTLQPTALVHEAFLKLVDQQRVDWRGQTHFLATAAQAMRRILVDHARRRQAAKRGGQRLRVELAEDPADQSAHDRRLLAVEDAITRLAALDPSQAQIVELRFFGGLSVNEVAQVMGLSKRSLEREWTMIRAWLRRELQADETS
jgi:RNA polymerase sigma factor (TIGR02999 family)